MCGITGIRRFDGRPVDVELLTAMTDLVEHRGPDGRGSWIDGPVGLGHTRLSIIDLAGSPQPMPSVDDRYHLTFNGEIFNYRQVRAELDYPFRTNGDTEVMLATVATGGLAACARLRGQFAFGLFDSITGDLYLARDRVGVLPLYYYVDREQVVFASEIKALLPAVPGGARLDHDSLRPYLRARAVPGPDTLFAGVKKVPPGHYVRVTAEGAVSVHAYWTVPDPGELLDITPEAAVDEVDAALGDAVDDALVADVPVGSYLSGGVDSSLIVALAAARKAPQPIETFAAEFGDPRYDETGFAQLISSKFGTNHHVVPVRAGDFGELWSQLTWHRDAPISEPADIAVARLAETARQHVKVVLSGEGSDELFGGYPKYRFAEATARAGLVPAAVRVPALRALERGLPAGRGRLRIAVRAMAGAQIDDRVSSWFAPFTEYECDALLGSSARPSGDVAPYRDAIDLMARRDLAAWLPDNLLERGDRMSMAHSLELRPPFLDSRLVDLAFRLPSSVKVRDGQTKWIVKQVAMRHLPNEIVSRPKVGFRVPLDSWFRGGLREMAGDLLGSGSFVMDVFDPTVVRQIVADHDSGRRDEQIRIWTLLSLEVWARRFLR